MLPLIAVINTTAEPTNMNSRGGKDRQGLRRVPVLIVGGGPVGLALAAELGWQGAACELIEQGDGAIATPKMNEVNIRTMEFCRRWGIAEAVHNCPFPADYPMDVAFLTSVSGEELGRLPRPPRREQKPGPLSPMNLQVCSQTWFDPILQEFARRHPPVRLRYRCRLDALEPQADAVIAEITDASTGTRERIAADYVVACDGAASGVRRSLGIGMTGPGTLGHPVHLFFRAPALLERHGKTAGTFFMLLDRDGPWANLRVIDPVNHVWRLMILDTDGRATPETVDKEGYLRKALGASTAALDVTWLGVSVWTRRSVVAERYAQERVFLAGDAAHQLSPTGALGMNTGIGDAVDLGWKLAAVQQGWGGARLLESYDAERRPIGDRNVRMAAEFHHRHAGFGEAMAAIEAGGTAAAESRRQLGAALVRDIGQMFRTAGLQLGYRYDGSPICVDDGSAPPPDDPENYVPSARPGARAPHAWIGDGRSTLDLFGRGFTLLRFAGDDATTAQIEAAARARGVPLRTLAITSDIAATLYETRLVLVRPDGHVAWRGDAPPADALALIDRLRGALAA
jgi:2-polyprenyl-6-methoxyphenol hydroxylase-like FAD-dependent oxidoreductase